MHPIVELYTSIYDFPTRRTAPRLSYMIATVPRTGSTYLSLALWRTGVLGAPMEYLNIANHQRFIEQRGNGDIVEYWEAIKACRTSSNGVFGWKMFFMDYLNLIERCPALLPFTSVDKVIRLRRKSLINQAISYTRAAQTAGWFADAPTLRAPSYDSEMIESALQSIDEQNRAWDAAMTIGRADVLDLFYEDLVAAPEVAVLQVAKHLGVKLDPALQLTLPVIQQQSDERTIEWRRRYESGLER